MSALIKTVPHALILKHTYGIHRFTSHRSQNTRNFSTYTGRKNKGTTRCDRRPTHSLIKSPVQQYRADFTVGLTNRGINLQNISKQRSVFSVFRSAGWLAGRLAVVAPL